MFEKFNAAADAAQQQWNEEERKRKLAEQEESKFLVQVDAWLKELADGSGGSLTIDPSRPWVMVYDKDSHIIRSKVDLRDGKLVAEAVDNYNFPSKDVPVDKTGFQNEFMKFMTDLVVRSITLTPHK
jgi:hypothetical protein